MTRILRVCAERSPIVGHSLRLAISVGLLFISARQAFAQCGDLQWRDRVGIAGVNGEVRQLLTWDPDGSGPLGRRLLIAGNFTSAGGQPTRNVAAFDGTRWLPMPLGANDNGSRYTEFQGQVVGLRQLSSTPIQCQPIRWTGATWESFGPPIARPGAFCAAAGQLLLAGREGGMQRWNGSEWETYPSPAGVWVHWIGEVHGRPHVAGLENNGGGPTRLFEQSLDGTWVALGGALSGYISSAVEFQGVLHVGGGITAAGNVAANGLARFNGEAWEPVGGGLLRDANPGYANALVVQGGTLYVAGYFTHAGGVASPNIAQWSGTGWTPMRADQTVSALVEFNGSVIGGSGSYFHSSNTVIQKYLASWTDGRWIGLGEGFLATEYGMVLALHRFQDRLFVGGMFTLDNIYMTVGIWNGQRLSGVGRVGETHGFTEYNGQLIAVGRYMGATPSSYHRAAMRWDGAQWSPIEAPGRPFQGDGITGVEFRGELVVIGQSLRDGTTGFGSIARWNGSNWSTLGSDGTQSLLDLIVFQDQLVVGGNFTTIGGLPSSGGVAAWDGTAWHGMGQIATRISDLCMYNGELYAATPNPPIRKWDGSQWVSVADYLTGTGSSIVAYDDKLYLFGDLQFAHTGDTARAARWENGAWTIVPTPPGLYSVDSAEVFRGELYVGQFGPLFDRLGPECMRGDMNGDGVVSANDVAGLAVAMLDPVLLGDTGQYLADVNADGRVDGRDVAAFVGLVTEP